MLKGTRVLQTRAITVDHGNMIYTVPFDKIGTKGKPVAFCEDIADQKIYLGKVYAVYDGMLFSQFKESYVDGTCKGMTTGMIIIDIDTGIECRTNTEVVMN